MASNNYITASEIGEYVYCPRGWRLKIHKPSDPTPQMIRGIMHHESLFSKIVWTPRMLIIAMLLIGIAVMLVLIIIQAIFRI